MFKSYKYRIYPTAEQATKIFIHCKHTNFIYNLALDTKQYAFKSHGVNLSSYDLMKQLTDLKKEFTWLKQSSTCALRFGIKNVDKAYINFFEHNKGYPKFRSSKRKLTYQVDQGTWLSENNKQIHLEKIGYVDIDLHRPIKGVIKVSTVSIKNGKYYISIMCDTQEPTPLKKIIKDETTIGIDLGLKTLITISNGMKYENQGFMMLVEKKLRREQRSLSRKKKGSNHWKKQKLVVGLLHEHIANKRAHYNHVLSTSLVRKYNTICIEDLNVAGMKKSNLASAIADVGWSSFTQMLKYKSEWYGNNLIEIGRFEPSSKLCSSCGVKNKNLTLDDREWSCSCGATHDRDINAAINIKNFGLNQIGLKRTQALANVTRVCV